MQTVTLYTIERRELRVPTGADSVTTMSMDLDRAVVPVNDDTPVFPDPHFSRENHPIIRLCRGGPEGIQERYIAVDRDTDQIIFDLADVKKQDYQAVCQSRDNLRRAFNAVDSVLRRLAALSFWGRLRWVVTGALPEAKE